MFPHLEPPLRSPASALSDMKSAAVAGPQHQQHHKRRSPAEEEGEQAGASTLTRRQAEAADVNCRPVLCLAPAAPSALRPRAWRAAWARALRLRNTDRASRRPHRPLLGPCAANTESGLVQALNPCVRSSCSLSSLSLSTKLSAESVEGCDGSVGCCIGREAQHELQRRRQ